MIFLTIRGARSAITMHIRDTFARALAVLRQRAPNQVTGFYPVIAGGPDPAARMLSDNQDAARAGVVLLAIGISCALALLFAGLATRFGDVAVSVIYSTPFGLGARSVGLDER